MADLALTLGEFVGLPISRIDELDIAALNLCAARGLPGTDTADVPTLVDRLDEWAERVELEIWRHIYRFDFQAGLAPTEFTYGNSLGRFFCWYMLQVLQEDCHVAYHPDRKFKPDFCQPEDLFIHGIVADGGKGGTCASMPVVYVAVGRRLGFPVHLVETRGHLLFRWDDAKGTTIHWGQPDLHLWIPPDRFNVEGSGEGIAYYPDSHYVQWPELWTETDFDHGRYLRSMTARENLAAFLVQRAECFHELGNTAECLKALHFARQLAPDDRRYEWLHAKRTRELCDHESTLDRIREIERKRISARRRIPGVPGHSPNCQCRQCETMRDGVQNRTIPPHGVSCECLHCRQARESQPRGVVGHSPNCRCPHCHPRHAEPALPLPVTANQIGFQRDY